MSKEKQLLTVEQAKEALPKGETIHVFLNPSGGMLIGGDWGRDEIYKLLDSADTIEVGGKECVRMGHGLVVTKDKRHHFVESSVGKN